MLLGERFGVSKTAVLGTEEVVAKPEEFVAWLARARSGEEPGDVPEGAISTRQWKRPLE